MKLSQNNSPASPSVVGSTAKSAILVVKNDPDTLAVLNASSRLQIFDLKVVDDGATALLMASRVNPSLILLDVGLTKVRWLEFYRLIRRDPALEHTPILISTNNPDSVCNLTDFGLGNTDFIVKPFTPEELVLRMRRLLYTRQLSDTDVSVLTYGDIQLDIARHEVTVDGTPVYLTFTEFKLLATLAQRQGRVQSREKLLQDVFDYNTTDIETRTIDTHIRRLRQKIGGARCHLETVRGVGYRFREKSRNRSPRFKLQADRETSHVSQAPSPGLFSRSGRSDHPHSVELES